MTEIPDIWVQPGRSPYTFRQKVKMALWWFVEKTLFRTSLHKMHGYRRFLLRLFGAKIGRGSGIHASARVWFPWNLEMGEESGVGFDALLYSLDRIVIGDRVTISQRVHINTGSHDIRSPGFELMTKPVVIRSGAFIGTDAYVGPGVTIGEMAVIGARSVVTKDMLPHMVCVGHPCRPVRRREKKE